jgi:hypothetical protein
VPTHAPPAPTLPAGVPLVLGVTGHRELRPADTEPLSTLVASIVGELQRMYTHTPLIVLTPLAEGADRLVAEVALAAGAWLVVPLPFARPPYEATFTDDASRRDFTRLLTHPRTLRVMELPALPDSAGAPRFDETTRRRFAYLHCGAFVARHSQLLLALWDGEPAHGTGGTAAVVEYRRTGRLTGDPVMLRQFELAAEPFAIPQRPLDAPEFGPVYQIVTPRPGQPVPANALSVRRLALAMYDDHPEQAAAYFAQLDRRWHEIDAYNAAAPAPALSAAADREPMIAALASAAAGASARARTNQTATYAALTSIFTIILAATVAFEGYAHLVRDDSVVSVLALGAYVALIAAAYIRFRHGRVVQTLFQDCRAVAEGFRVQLAWRRAGMPHSVADHYLRKHADELTWIRDAVDAWSTCTPPANPPDLDAAAQWIASQRHFYTKAAHRDGDALATHRQGGAGWVAGGIIGATVWVLAQSVIGLGGSHRGDPAFWAYLVALIMVVAACGIFVWQGLRRMFTESGEDANVRKMLGGAGCGVVAVLVVAAIPAFLTRMRDVLHVGIPDWIVSEQHAWIVVALGLVTLIGAFHHTFAEQRAFAEHRNQYERMAKLFERGQTAFDERRAAGDRAAIEQLLVALGAEALAEHADWLVLHRERPLQIPKVEI